MFRIFFPRKHKVDTVRQVQFEPLSYTSVAVHIPPLSSHFTHNLPTIIQELRPETPPPTTQTRTACPHQTFPGSYTETPLHSRHLPLIEVPSRPMNIHGHLEVSDDELGSE